MDAPDHEVWCRWPPPERDHRRQFLAALLHDNFTFHAASGLGDFFHCTLDPAAVHLYKSFLPLVLVQTYRH